MNTIFDEELILKSWQDIYKIHNNKYTVAVYNNYCQLQNLLDIEKENFVFDWRFKFKNDFSLKNKRLEFIVKETSVLFESLTGGDFKVELEKIFRKDSCILFHEDNVKLRLLITLSGVGGTQYTDNSNINFNVLDDHWDNPDERNNSLIKDWNKIKTVNVGDLLILKGKKNKQKSVFHRSFPLSNDIDSRYVLKLTQA